MNTTENNKIIAEFLSVESSYHKGHYICPNGIATEPKDMRFDSDWNWLMEVVDKIYETDLYYDKYIDYNSSMFSNGGITLGTRIDRVYNACIEFIKWYNLNK